MQLFPDELHSIFVKSSYGSLANTTWTKKRTVIVLNFIAKLFLIELMTKLWLLLKILIAPVNLPLNLTVQIVVISDRFCNLLSAINLG